VLLSAWPYRTNFCAQAVDPGRGTEQPLTAPSKHRGQTAVAAGMEGILTAFQRSSGEQAGNTSTKAVSKT